MIVALDIETIGNKEVIPMLPEPEIKTGNLKDAAKIAAKKAEAREKQIKKMALDPLTGRVVCAAFVASDGNDRVLIPDNNIDSAKERDLLQQIFNILGTADIRLVSWNGIGFDLPFIYKRAIVLGVDPANFNAPPLSAWTSRYKTDRHYDLMQIWGNWRDFIKLDTVAKLVLGKQKDDCDVTKIAEMMETAGGRKQVADYCLQDTRLTMEIFKAGLGYLYV